MVRSGGNTIVDVLEDVLGELTPSRAQKLTSHELEILADRVNQFYATWSAPPLSEDEFRVYSGGWIAGNLAAAESRQYLYTSLVYAPSVIMHDPIAEWFYPHRAALQSPPAIPSNRGMLIQGAEPQLLMGDGFYQFREQPERSRDRLAGNLQTIALLAPLIRAGAIVPIPHLEIMKRQQSAILSAVRHDVGSDEFLHIVANPIDQPPPRSDHIRGMDIAPSDGVRLGHENQAISQNPSYFLNKTLGIANATGSRYVPPAATDAALLEYRVRSLGMDLARRDIDLQVTAALTATDLPFLGDLDVTTLLAIRQDEAAFVDWRAELRGIARLLEGTPSEGAAFTHEAKEVISDALLPRAREIQRVVARSAVMKSAVREQALEFGIGSASVTGAALLIGTPVAATALAGLGIAAVGRWVYSSVFGGSESGTKGVLATLVKRR